MSFESAYQTVKQLVADFSANEKFYLSPKYQEAEVRKDFIDKFFIALGWDVHHDEQKNPYEQEVKVEKGVVMSGAQKRADYSFSLAPNFRDAKFFVEAKKPSHDLYNADYYFQTVRYGWHKATPLVVLTDFEEFHILDCRSGPDISTVLSCKLKYFHYSEYVDDEKFAEIYWLFSRESVANNSLEKFAETLSKPRGKAVAQTLFPYGKHRTIDEDFLNEIENKREILAKAFKNNDETLTSEELTEATQRTIDRLVFIRFLEDKLIEPDHYMHEFGENRNPWIDFISLCRRLDGKYNGIVFKRSFIDDNKFKGPVDSEFLTVCQDLCHLNSRFLFNEIPIHILGSIYERFLGKVVHATDHRVKIEEKPEVRKAGGVYYTPKYIVDYIVRNTVGKLIDGKTPEQISRLRFADIACGSGSFLIGVLDCLLYYHNKYYQLNPDRAKKDGCHYKDGLWVLNIKQKQNILRNNIYGVDIDAQAVEVTQLSLSLKMLEDETTATANEMQVLLHEKILPDMSKNIICGNSLIGTDILSQNNFDREEERKLNPMDFEGAFPEVMRNGGFDAIVGNPPYRTLQLGKKQESESKEVVAYYLSHYPASSLYKINLFALFIDRAICVLKNKGLFSYIVPNAIYSAYYYKDLRKLALKNGGFEIIADLRYKVFKDAEIGGNAVFVYSKNNNIITTSVFSAESMEVFLHPIIEKTSSNSYLKNENYNLTFAKELQIITDKIKELKTIPLGSMTKIYQGIITGDNKKYISDKPINSKWQKIIKGRDINRFELLFDNNYVYYSPKDLWSNTDINMFKVEEKIISRQTSDRLIATIDTEQYFSLDSTHVIHLTTQNISLKYLLGIYNSSLINYLYQNSVKESGRVFAQVKVVNIKPLPIKEINFQNKTEKNQHDKMVRMVEQILDAKKQLRIAKTDKDKAYYQRRSTELDAQIDNLVYELYGLTEDEIMLIEGMKKGKKAKVSTNEQSNLDFSES